MAIEEKVESLGASGQVIFYQLARILWIWDVRWNFFPSIHADRGSTPFSIGFSMRVTVGFRRAFDEVTQSFPVAVVITK